MPAREADLCETLSADDVARYERDGYIVIERRLPPDVVAACKEELRRFHEAARGLTESDDRLDLEDSHPPENPRVRRIKLPHKSCEPVRDLLFSDHILAPVRDLIGPNLRLHTSKLNMKSAGFGAAVEWHQDFAFYPHTNDDVLAVGVLIDDMAERWPLKLRIERGQNQSDLAGVGKGGELIFQLFERPCAEIVKMRDVAVLMKVRHAVSLILKV